MSKEPKLISYKYTDQQVTFLDEMRAGGLTWAEIALEYNKKFKCKPKKSPETLRICYINNEGKSPKVEMSPETSKVKKGKVGDLDTSSILVISDQHMPYDHPDMFDFLEAVKKKYKPTMVVNIGDECFPEESEILTSDGFKTFRDVIDQKLNVMQWNKDSSITEVTPERYIDKAYSGKLLRVEHRSYLSLTTPNHSIVKINPKTGNVHKREAWDTEGSDSWEIPRVGNYSGEGVKLSNAQIQLQVAFQADGTFDRGAVKFEFSKERKIDRLKVLLSECDVDYNLRLTGRETTVMYIEVANVPSYLTKLFKPNWIGELNESQRGVLLDELVHWDGTLNGVGFRYSSSVTSNLDFVQALASSSGRYTNLHDLYVDVHSNRTEKTSQKSAIRAEVEYNGNVTCVTVPSGMIIVRQEGHVSVSGNCDKHALSFHDSDVDLPSAGYELELAIGKIKRMEKMFPDMILVDSNHGSLALRKFKHHGIPMKYLASQHEIYGVSQRWQWMNSLTVKLPNGQDCFFCHGMIKSGIKLAAQRGTNVVQGHYHTEFKIDYIGNPSNLLFSLQVGCLIDSKSLAFAYDKLNLNRPIIGTGLVVDSKPVLVPMTLSEGGRWNGKL